MKQTNQNIKQALAEQANLQDMLTKFKNKQDILEKSLATYKDKYVVSPANIPADLNYIEKVLNRFFETNKIKDIFDLVDNHPELLAGAIDFVKPSSNTRDPLRSDAYRSLNKLKDNLDEYENFRTENNDGLKNKDGFKNYIEKVRLINEVEKAYQDLMSHTGNLDLDPSKLPETVAEVKAMQLAIAAPLGKEGEPVSEQTKTSYNEDFDENGNFEVGSKSYFAKMYKIVRDNATGDITQRKLSCYEDVMQFRIKFYACSNSQKDATNIDLKCGPIHNQYENSKANCESHFPMVTISDAVIDSMLERIERIHMTQDLQITMDSAIGAVKDYDSLKSVLRISPSDSIKGLGYKISSSGEGEPLLRTATDLLGVSLPAIDYEDSAE